MNNKHKKFKINKGTKPPRIEGIDYKNKNDYSKHMKLKNNQITISGKHSVLSALKNTHRKLFYLISTPEHHMFWSKELEDLEIKIDIKIKEKDALDEINNFKPHQNIILVTEPLKRISLDEFLIKKQTQLTNPIRIILLDQVTDPQNVGAIIRSAHAFKMDGLALSQRNSPLETAAMSKASSGAIEKLEIIELSNMAREIKKLQQSNFTVYGLAHGGPGDVFDLENEKGNIAVIVGSEGKGLRRLTREKVDKLITIPINEESESLNVANAASITMFQLQKNIIKN
jgi:23S rRNA (guanosine2251-2'-O)-methyltransferase